MYCVVRNDPVRCGQVVCQIGEVGRAQMGDYSTALSVTSPSDGQGVSAAREG
jgi:hypothetical protein